MEDKKKKGIKYEKIKKANVSDKEELYKEK